MNKQDYTDQHGHTYKYDPDYDCYYRVYGEQDLTHWSQYNWLYVTLVLAVLCWITA